MTAHDGYEQLGQTLDDAAGEALDKAARLLGLGYPGGPAIEREATGGDPDAFELPRAMTNDPRLDFSFSGLKTALLYAVRELGPERTRERRADLAASFQAAIVEQLVAKLRRAARGGSNRHRDPKAAWRAVALGGGVAANSLLRERVDELCEREGLELKLVARELCTDNAAMIASAARFVEAQPFDRYAGWDARALRSSSTGDRGATCATSRASASSASTGSSCERSTSSPTSVSSRPCWSGFRWSRSEAGSSASWSSMPTHFRPPCILSAP